MYLLISLLQRNLRNAWYSFLLFFTFCLLFILTLIPNMACGQVTGLWKTVDDQDGREIAIVEIFEKDNKLFGRVIKVLPKAKRTICERCSGDLKGKPITGMLLLQNLTITPTGGENGKVLDPSSGHTFSCYIELVGQDKLKLRGYLGMPSIGRTQYWYRIPA
jgi:uncharacterized protein (DUF2147 family)